MQNIIAYGQRLCRSCCCCCFAANDDVYIHVEDEKENGLLSSTSTEKEVSKGKLASATEMNDAEMIVDGIPVDNKDETKLKLKRNGIRIQEGRLGVISAVGPYLKFRSDCIKIKGYNDVAVMIKEGANQNEEEKEESKKWKVFIRKEEDEIYIENDEIKEEKSMGWTTETHRNYTRYGRKRIETSLMCLNKMLSQSIKAEVKLLIIHNILSYLNDFDVVKINKNDEKGMVKINLLYELVEPYPSTRLFMRIEGNERDIPIKEYHHAFVADYCIESKENDEPPIVEETIESKTDM